MIKLDGEKENLLIPLYGKAMDYKSGKSILKDRDASEIVSAIDYPFDTLDIKEKNNRMMTIRAKLIDDYVAQFLDYNPDTTVIQLGCGLDSRVKRVESSRARWYDIDLEEVIALRRQFYEETFAYRMVGSSVTKDAWINGLRIPSESCLVIAEGLFMYLREEEIRSLMLRLKDKLGAYTLIFDAYSKMTARHASKHSSVSSTGAKIQWGFDKPDELEGLIEGLTYRHARYFTKNFYVGGLAFGTRVAYGIAHRFKMARDAHRILVYEVR